MTVTSVSVEEEGVVRLILEFLDSRKLHKAMRSLEKDSGVVNCSYPDDVLFLRELVLDGEWGAVLVFAQPFEGVGEFDSRLFRYYVLKQKFMEVLYFKSGVGGGTTGYSIEDLIKCLNQLEQDCPDKNEYSKLCWLLTVSNLSEQPEYRDWNPETARMQCFEDILNLLKKILPINSKKRCSTTCPLTPAKDRLVSLLVNGLCFENCVEYCQHRAINGDLGEDFAFPWRERLLTGLSQQASGNFLSWLRNLEQDAFTTAFEPMAVEVELKKVPKSNDFIAKKSVKRDDVEVISRSLSLSGRPATADGTTPSVSVANKRNAASDSRPQSAGGRASNTVHFRHDELKKARRPLDGSQIQLDTAQTGSEVAGGEERHIGNHLEPTEREEYSCQSNAGDDYQYKQEQRQGEARHIGNHLEPTEREDYSHQPTVGDEYQYEQEQRQSLLQRLEEHERSKEELRRQLMNFSPALPEMHGTSVSQEGSNRRTVQSDVQVAEHDLNTGTDGHPLSPPSRDQTTPVMEKGRDTMYHECLPTKTQNNTIYHEHLPTETQNDLMYHKHLPTKTQNQQGQVSPEHHPDANPYQGGVSQFVVEDDMTSTPLPKSKTRIQKQNGDTGMESQSGTTGQGNVTHRTPPKSSGLWIALDDGPGMMNTSTPKSRKNRTPSSPRPPASPIPAVDDRPSKIPVLIEHPTDNTGDGFRPISSGPLNENKENSGQTSESVPQRCGPKVNGVRRALVSKQKPLPSEGKVEEQNDFQTNASNGGKSGPVHVQLSEPENHIVPDADDDKRQHKFGRPTSQPEFHVVASLEDPQAVRSVAFHPGGELFAVGANSKILRICSASALSGQRSASNDSEVSQPTILFKRSRHHRGSIYCTAWNNTGDLIATGSNDKSIKILRFDAVNHTQVGPEVEMNVHAGTVRDLTFVAKSSGSPVLLSGGAGDGNIIISDCSTGQTVGQLKGHAGHIMSVYASCDGIIASGSADNTVRLWDLRSQRCIDVMATGDSCVASVCINTPGNLLASGHEDGGCMIYDITAGRTLQFFKPHSLDCRSVRFSLSSDFLLSGSYDASIVLMDLKQNLESAVPPHFVVGEHRDKVIQCRWHPHSLAFVSSSADRTANLWALKHQ